MTPGIDDTTLAVGDTFYLPDLGEGLTEGEIVRWLVDEGDVVSIDQPLVEVETAKSIVEIPSPFAGRVATLHAEDGQRVDVGAALVTITNPTAAVTDDGIDAVTDTDADAAEAADTYREEEQAGSGNVLIGYGTPGNTRPGRRRPRPRATTPGPLAGGATRSDTRPSTDPSTGSAARSGPATSPAAASSEGRPPIRTLPRSVTSPLVRRLARDGGVDLAQIAGTGAGGVITRADVVRALTAQSVDTHREPDAESTAAPDRRIPLTGFQKAAAAQLTRSRTQIPEATVWVDVDATRLWGLREDARTTSDPGPSLLAYLARFAVAGLRRHPDLNSRFDADREELVRNRHVHLGLAIQSPRGLIAPAVMDADAMTTDELDSAIRNLVTRARAGKATTQELTEGTFTLNNYGRFRVDGSAPIINHPQVAMLGFGRILDRPWVVDGDLCVRKITQMSFAFDHRVCDGIVAAEFMRVVGDAIENPAEAIRNL